MNYLTQARSWKKILPPRVFLLQSLTHAGTQTQFDSRTFATSEDKRDLAFIHKSPIVQHLWKQRAALIRVGPLGKPQESLLAKTVADSRVQVHYPFKNDRLLRESYMNFNGLVQYSRIFEDLDALAGNVAFQHCDDGNMETRMPKLVTASVDRIRLNPGVVLSLDKNYRMIGQVMWVGRTALIIRMELVDDDDDSAVLSSNFTYVARDVVTGRGISVNTLQPETDEEKRLYQAAEESAQARKRLRKTTPQSDDQHNMAQLTLVQELLEQGRILTDMPGLAVGDAVLISQTKKEMTVICQPQQRNTAGRVFGGYLMRLAYRTAYSTAYMFAGSVPHFLEVDKVSFLKPVEVGNILEVIGRVMLTYTKVRPVIHVEVIASVLKPEDKCSEITNTFNFTFELKPKEGQGLPNIKRVFPSTELEARRVVAIMNTQTE